MVAYKKFPDFRGIFCVNALQTTPILMGVE